MVDHLCCYETFPIGVYHSFLHDTSIDYSMNSSFIRLVIDLL